MLFDGAGNLYFADSASNRSRQPDDLVFDPGGNLYIAEYVAHVVRLVDSKGIIRTLAGTGQAGV
jgi:hypothetical protein